MQRYDVIVIGAGIAGSSAAYALAQHSRVLLLEQHRFLHSLGSSHGGSRIFRYAYPEPQYVAMARAAEEGWRALEQAQGEKLLTTTGGLDIAAAGSPDLNSIESALQNAGLTVERLNAAEVHRRFPAFQPQEHEEALYQASAGVVAATRAVNAYLRGAVRRGATLLDQEQVSNIQLTGSHASVTTQNGTYTAERLVVTAGAWLGSLTPELKLPLTVKQQQVLYARTANPAEHLPARMPIFIHHHEGNHIYGFPLFDDPVAIKIADHSRAPTITLPERSTDLLREWAQSTIERAQKLLPGLTGELRNHDMCLYTMTPDEHFVLDTHPQHQNVVIAGGFSGHGFKFGPAIGEAITNLSENQTPSYDLSLFSIRRFTTTQLA